MTTNPAATLAHARQAPFRPLTYVKPQAEIERRSDGTILLRSPITLGETQHNIASYLRLWSQVAPQRPMFAERDRDGTWRRVTYGEVRRVADRVGQALLDRGLGLDRPIMILSSNSINQAILVLGALTVGVPIVPVSVAYALASSDYEILRHTEALVSPGLIFVQNGRGFELALKSLDLRGCEVVFDIDRPLSLEATSFDVMCSALPSADVDQAYAAVNQETVAKVMFTSGSTGMPKGVMQTHGMLCANQRMMELIQPLDPNDPPVLLDWLPWSHTFAGNSIFNSCIQRGGLLHIDTGRPLPGLFEPTIKNLREVSPTSYTNVPAGFSMLLSYLERDDELRRAFCRPRTFHCFLSAVNHCGVHHFHHHPSESAKV